MSNQPAAKLRDGVLSVTIWKNEREDDKAYYTSILSKSYKDGDEWKDTDNLNADDLLKAAHLLQQAYSKILELKAE